MQDIFSRLRKSFKVNPLNSIKGKISVTVCIATVCGGNTIIIGAADRMITAGDIEFEPQQTKIIQLSNSIAVMIAGDSSMQAEIIQKVYADVGARIKTEPTNWWNVADVAGLYNQYYADARFKRAERDILFPLGLNRNTFISRQKEMDPKLVSQLATELINFVPPSISAIFTGVDNTGPHIYIAENGSINCQDLVGFSAIGVGAWHANSQIMFAGHDRWKLVPETLLLAYSAKKRAEVAPGVGEATDMFTIGPALGSFTYIGDHVLIKLKEIYEAEQKREMKANLKARSSVNEYVEEIAKAATAKEQAKIPLDSGGDTSANKKELGDGHKEEQPKN